MASSIKIKRSSTLGNPGTLGVGELAYSSLAGTDANGGDRLYIGTGSEASGNASVHDVIGGKYFADMLDHTPGTLTASSAIVVNASGKVDVVKTTNLQIGGAGVTNVIAATDTNGGVEITPNGTGLVKVGAFTVPNSTGTDGYVLTSTGSGSSVWAVSSMSSIPANMTTFLGTPSSANLIAAMSDETGTGALVFATSPTLVTPALGIPSSVTLTNATGLPVSTGVSGLASGIASFLAVATSANLAAAVTDETGTGALVFATSPTLVTPALGTPSGLIGTNITGTAAGFTAGTVTTNANLTGHITSTGNAAVLGSFSSANLLAALTDKTGTGVNVFATSPSFTDSVLATTTTFSAFNTTATTLNIGGAATSLSLGAATGTTTINNSLAISGHVVPIANITYDLGSAAYRFRDLYLSGNTINLGASTISGSATGISLTSLNGTPIGATTASTGAFTTLSTTGDITVGGNLTVNGTTTTINSTVVTVDDILVELGSVATPTNTTANGGGILLKGTTDKTITWDSTYSNWNSSEDWNIVTGKVFKINNASVLSSTTLGSTVTASSLTSVGTLTTGVWNGTVLTPVYGGTGLATVTSRGILFGNGTSTIGVTAAATIDGSFLKSDSTGNPFFSNLVDGGTYE